MTAAELVQNIQDGYDGELIEARSTSDQDAWVGVPAENVVQMAEYLRDSYPPLHLSTITGVDRGEVIDVIYHFIAEGVSLNVRAAVDKSGASIDSITPAIPAAILYEREVADLLGVEFAGHPDPRRLILPEDWPEGEYPLRKSSESEETEQANG
ncbi:MAG: NADH-quinone oxidoreductase subunit C [Armatimonadetes bacterium]|nr:NADH-quinone oxidoreductase subunit C [Armatimonadota bacterium]